MAALTESPVHNTSCWRDAPAPPAVEVQCVFVQGTAAIGLHAAHDFFWCAVGRHDDMKVVGANVGGSKVHRAQEQTCRTLFSTTCCEQRPAGRDAASSGSLNVAPCAGLGSGRGPPSRF